MFGYFYVVLSQRGPSMTFPHIDGANALAGFGVLAVLVTTLQVAVRTSPPRPSEHVRSARNQFLVFLASLLIPVSLGFGCYVGLQFALTPTLLDPIRTFGPMAGGLLVALLAADAAAAAPIPEDSEVARRARLQTRVDSLREQVTVITAGAMPASRAQRIADAGVLLLGLALAIVIVQLVSPTDRPSPLAWHALFVTIHQAVVTVAVYHAVLAVMRKAWGELAAMASLVVAAVLAIHLLVVVTIVENSDAQTWVQRTAGYFLTVLTGAVLAAASTVLMMRPTKTKEPRQRLLQGVAVVRAERALARAIERGPSAPAPALSGLGLASVMLSPVFPLGLVLVQALRRQLNEMDPRRRRVADRRAAVAATILSWSVPAVLIAALVVLMVLTPVVP